MYTFLLLYYYCYQRNISDCLFLENPIIIAMSLPPDQPNLMLFVEELPKIEDYTRQLSEGLRFSRIKYPKTIIFCQSYQDLSGTYSSLIHYLGVNKTKPPGYPNVLKVESSDCVFQSYHTRNEEDIYFHPATHCASCCHSYHCF